MCVSSQPRQREHILYEATCDHSHCEHPDNRWLLPSRSDLPHRLRRYRAIPRGYSPRRYAHVTPRPPRNRRRRRRCCGHRCGRGRNGTRIRIRKGNVPRPEITHIGTAAQPDVRQNVHGALATAGNHQGHTTIGHVNQPPWGNGSAHDLKAHLLQITGVADIQRYWDELAVRNQFTAAGHAGQTGQTPALLHVHPKGGRRARGRRRRQRRTWCILRRLRRGNRRKLGRGNGRGRA